MLLISCRAGCDLVKSIISRHIHEIVCGETGQANGPIWYHEVHVYMLTQRERKVIAVRVAAAVNKKHTY